MQHELALGVEAEADEPGPEQRHRRLARAALRSPGASIGSSGYSSAMRSRNATASVASSATCSFSTSTVSSACPCGPGCRTCAAPGSPTAPAPRRVDGVELDDARPSRAGLDVSSASVGSSRSSVLGGGGSSSSSEPVSLHFTSIAAPCVPKLEHRDRRRRHAHALEQVEVHAGVVRDRGLDRVGVRHDHDQSRCGWRGDDRPRARRPCAPASRRSTRRRGSARATARAARSSTGRSWRGRRSCRRSIRRSRPRSRPAAAAPRARGASAMRCRGLRGALDRARVDDRDRQLRQALAERRRPARRPLSDRSMPGVRPESSGPVCAVTAWRTSTSRVGRRAAPRLRRRRRRSRLGASRRRSVGHCPEFYRRSPLTSSP